MSLKSVVRRKTNLALWAGVVSLTVSTGFASPAAAVVASEGEPSPPRAELEADGTLQVSGLTREARSAGVTVLHLTYSLSEAGVPFTFGAAVRSGEPETLLAVQAAELLRGSELDADDGGTYKAAAEMLARKLTSTPSLVGTADVLRVTVQGDEQADLLEARLPSLRRTQVPSSDAGSSGIQREAIVKLRATALERLPETASAEREHLYTLSRAALLSGDGRDFVDYASELIAGRDPAALQPHHASSRYGIKNWLPKEGSLSGYNGSGKCPVNAIVINVRETDCRWVAMNFQWSSNGMTTLRALKPQVSMELEAHQDCYLWVGEIYEFESPWMVSGVPSAAGPYLDSQYGNTQHNMDVAVGFTNAGAMSENVRYYWDAKTNIRDHCDKSFSFFPAGGSAFVEMEITRYARTNQPYGTWVSEDQACRVHGRAPAWCYFTDGAFEPAGFKNFLSMPGHSGTWTVPIP